MADPKVGDLVTWEEYHQVQFVPVHHVYMGIVVLIEDMWAKVLTTEGSTVETFLDDLEVVL